MREHLLRNTVWLSMLGALLAACGDDEGGGVVAGGTSGSGGRDRDAGGEEEIDAAVSMDASGLPTGFHDSGLVGRCAVDTDDVYTAISSARPLQGAPLAVDPINSRFAIPYVDLSAECVDAVFVTSLPRNEDPVTEKVVDECSSPRSPVLAASGDDWLVALVDNRSGQYDVWLQKHDAAMGEGQRLSDTSSEEKALSIAHLEAGGFLVAWADEDSEGVGSLYVRAVDDAGVPTGDAQVVDTWQASQGADPAQNPKLIYRNLVMAPLIAGGAALAYWRHEPITSSHSSIVLRVLDDDGKPVGDERVITGNAGALGSVDIDINELGGGIVYTQREAQTGRQVWFQELDDAAKPAPASGSPDGNAPAVRLVNSPFLGVDVSIAKLASTYVVVYRALPALDQERAVIRAVFMNSRGDLIGSSDVAYTSNAGGRTAIETSYDGRVVISWSEVSEFGDFVTRVVNLPCVGG